MLVSTKVKDGTAARYTVRDPREVQSFLEVLVAWGHTPDNGWHTAGPGGGPGWPPLTAATAGPSNGVPTAAGVGKVVAGCQQLQANGHHSEARGGPSCKGGGWDGGG